jgi:hypothetical protein
MSKAKPKDKPNAEAKAKAPPVLSRPSFAKAAVKTRAEPILRTPPRFAAGSKRLAAADESDADSLDLSDDDD